MKKFLAKIVSGVVALATVAMTFACIPMLNASAAGNGVKVYFKNTANWKQVNAYFWYGSGSTGAGWPGVEMKDNGDGWLVATYTGSKPLNVIFSDNTKPKANQTANHKPDNLDNTKAAYWFVPTEAKADNPGGMGSGATVTVYTEKPAEAAKPAATSSSKAATTTTSSAAAKTATKDKTPATGDNSMLPIAGAAAVISLAGIAFVVSKRKNK